MTPSCDMSPDQQRRPLGRRKSRKGNRLWGFDLLVFGLAVLVLFFYYSTPEEQFISQVFILGVFFSAVGGLQLSFAIVRRHTRRRKRNILPSAPWHGDRGWKRSSTDDKIPPLFAQSLHGIGVALAILLIVYYGSP